jgi:hypothetical protein
MPHYVQQYIKNMLEKTGDLSRAHFEEIYREIERFDPRDFEPEVRAVLVSSRVRLKNAIAANRRSKDDIEGMLGKIIAVFNGFRGEGSGGAKRSFPFLSDPDLQRIVERDYLELRLKVYPDGAWKCTVILAGSILEAILFDQLGTPAWNGLALGSSSAPKNNGAVIPLEKWKLEKLIDVAVDIGRLPTDPANTIHQVLRDYRNFVHPKKEIRSSHSLTEAEAMLAVGALDSICNYFEENP